jgi:hypothetical protein
MDPANVELSNQCLSNQCLYNHVITVLNGVA